MVNYKVRSLALEAAFTIGAAMETELPHKLSSSFIKASPGNEAQHKTKGYKRIPTERTRIQVGFLEIFVRILSFPTFGPFAGPQ